MHKHKALKRRYFLSITMLFVFSLTINFRGLANNELLHKFFGEFIVHAYFYIFLALLVLVFTTYKINLFHYRLYIPNYFKIFLFIFTIAVFVSSFINIDNILSAFFKGRYGTTRLFTSILTHLFVLFAIIFILNWLIYLSKLFGHLFYEKIEKTYNFICVFSVIICLTELTNLTFFNFEFLYNIKSFFGDRTRISYLTFEPSIFGCVYLVFIIPFLLYKLKKEKHKKKYKYLTTLLLIVFISFMTESRMATIMPLFLIAVSALLSLFKFIQRRRVKVNSLFAIPFLLIFLVIFIALNANLFYEIIILRIYSLIDFDQASLHYSLSTRARYGMNLAAYNMYKDNILGVGLGQFGFSVNQYFDTIFSTAETQRWLSNESMSIGFPNSYNMHLHILSELGIIGGIAYEYLWLYLLLKSFFCFVKERKNYFIFEINILYMLGLIIYGFNFNTMTYSVLIFSNVTVMFVLYKNKHKSKN